jgi:hypothetical protein
MRPPQERIPRRRASLWVYVLPALVVGLAAGFALALPSAIESCPPPYAPGRPCFVVDERVLLRVAIVLLGILVAGAIIVAGRLRRTK